MKRTNKILITIILISSLLLSIGYSAINNITLDIEGKAVAIPTTRILVTGEEFNKILKNATSTTTADTTITKIVFDYWGNGYSENGVVVFEESDWGKGTPIDADGLGGIKLFKSDDGTKACILSETQIYANINCKDMFYHMEGVTEIVFNNFDTSKVENMFRFFRRCDAIQTLDLSSFNTSNVTSFAHMFGGCKNLNKIIGLNLFNTSNANNMYAMFYSCENLITIDLSGFDTSNVTTIQGMFQGCEKLTKVDLSNFNTSKVNNMGDVFYRCSTLKEVNFGSNFNTSKVQDMSSMFFECKELKKIDVTGFDTSNVTDMKYMFGYCVALTEIDVSNFKTSNVTNLDRMFTSCRAIRIIDLSNFDTSNVTSMKAMFKTCSNLTTIYVSDKWNTEKVNHIDIVDDDQPFLDCTNLVGGAGTTYDSNNVDITYARIDGGPDSETPGYLTLKNVIN